jgi:hypothetical protein
MMTETIVTRDTTVNRLDVPELAAYRHALGRLAPRR